MGPVDATLGRRAGIRTASVGPSRGSIAAILHHGVRFDRWKRRELAELVDHDRELIAKHRARRGTGARREKSPGEKPDDKEPQGWPQHREHQAARPVGGSPTGADSVSL